MLEGFGGETVPRAGGGPGGSPVGGVVGVETTIVEGLGERLWGWWQWEGCEGPGWGLGAWPVGWAAWEWEGECSLSGGVGRVLGLWAEPHGCVGGCWGGYLGSWGRSGLVWRQILWARGEEPGRCLWPALDEVEERKDRSFHGGALHLLGSGRGLGLARADSRAGISKGWDWQGLALGLVLALWKWQCPLGQGVMGSALGWLRALVERRARGRRVKALAGISAQQFMAWAGAVHVWHSCFFPICSGEPIGTGGVE